MNKKQSKLIIRITLLVGTIISMFFVPWLLVKAWILPLPDTVQEQLDEAIGHGFDGMIVYIDQAGKPSQYFASGWHNREAKIPAKPKALFKIVRIRKLYDVVAITKLVSDGRLSLDKTIADYLPELTGRIENADKITLRLMIQHRSGIPNFTDTPNFWATPTQSYEESLALILDKPANFETGEDYEYCNTNYLLINKIMDDSLGVENFQLIQNKNIKHIRQIIPVIGLNEFKSTISTNIVIAKTIPIIQANLFCCAPTYSGTWFLTNKRPIIKVG